MLWLSLVIRQIVCQPENLVASAQFLIALATSESEFQALNQKNITMYYINSSVVLENTPLKIHTKPHLRLGWYIFHILTSEDIVYFTDIKCDP